MNVLINKEKAFSLYEQGYSYQEIANQFNVSRQRIHQIIKHYSNFGRRSRKKKYKNIGICVDCKINPATLLHHSDYNNENDNQDNLVPLCQTCHSKRHVGRLHRKKMRIDKTIYSNIGDSRFEYLQTDQVAKIYSVDEQTIRRWAKQGLLISQKIGARFFFPKNQFIASSKIVCTWCGEEITGYNSEEDLKEAHISGMCQSCINKTFGENK